MIPRAVVVGGGPAGSATAIGLARAGFNVTLLDKARFPRPKACAEFLSPEGVALLRRQRLGEVVENLPHAETDGMRLVARNGKSHLLRFPADDAPRKAFGIRRDVLDAALLDAARAAGVDVREGAQVIEVLKDGATVTGVGTRDAGMFASDLLVGADGLNSVVAANLTTRSVAGWPSRVGLVTRYEGVSLKDGYGEMHVGNRRYCGIAPLGNGLTNVAVVGEAGDVRDAGGQRFFDDTLKSLPALEGPLSGATRVEPLRGMGPLARQSSRVHGNGWLLVGDAAGFFDPFTGEGIYEALRGAELAVSVAAPLLAAGRFGNRELAAYSRTRKRAFGDKRRLDRLIQVFVQHDRMFNLAVARLAGKPAISETLAAAIGNYGSPGAALHPFFLWRLVAPYGGTNAH